MSHRTPKAESRVCERGGVDPEIDSKSLGWAVWAQYTSAWLGSSREQGLREVVSKVSVVAVRKRTGYLHFQLWLIKLFTCLTLSLSGFLLRESYGSIPMDIRPATPNPPKAPFSHCINPIFPLCLYNLAICSHLVHPPIVSPGHLVPQHGKQPYRQCRQFSYQPS